MTYSATARIVCLALTAILATRTPVVGNDAAGPNEVRELVAAVQSSAAPEAKATACKRLAIVGGKEAVPALAALLADETLACYARCALETIPDPAADEALREALGKLHGARLAGAISSIGVRRDVKAVDGLVKALADKDADVASCAAIALGRIASPAAAQSLQQALAAVAPAVGAAVAEACLMCAEQRMRDGRPEEAAAIADAVRKANVSKSMEAAAIRNLVVARPAVGLPLLLEGLKTPRDKTRFGLALRLIREVPGSEITQVALSVLKEASPEVQALLIPAVVDRKDATARVTIETLAASQAPEVRRAAIAALGNIGSASSVPVLVKSVEAGKSPDESGAALASLRLLPGPETDALILKALPSIRPAARAQLIGVLEDRNAVAAAADLLKLAADPDTEIAKAAFHALSVVAGPGELPEIVRLLAVCKDETVRESAERAALATSAKMTDAARRADPILGALGHADPVGKCALLGVLGRIGNPQAYEAIRAAMNDPDARVRLAALRSLAGWPDATPADVLLSVVAGTKEPVHRGLALQAVLRMAGAAAAGSDPPSPRVIGWFQQARHAAGSVEEKRLLLSGLAQLGCVEGLQMAWLYRADASVGGEAALAVTQIAAKLKLPAEDLAKIEAALPAKAPAAPRKPRRLLIFDLNVGYGGHPSRFTANAAFALMGAKTGAFETTVSRDPSVFQPDSLRQFDAVFLNNTVGNLFEDPALRQSLIEFVYGGGGLLGVHGTSVAFTRWPEGAREDWPEFAVMLGTRGAFHRANTEHIFIKLDDPDHPVCRPWGGKGFEYRDEFFRPQGTYSRNRDRVLLSIDTEKTDLKGQARDRAYREDNDYALAWVRQYGRGRVFYSTIAHNPYVFWDAKMLEFYLAGAQFALGDLPAPTTPSAKLTPAVRAQEQLGWRLGIEADRSGKSTLFETIDQAARLGVLHVGGRSSQKVSGETPKDFGPQLADKELEQIRLKLDAAGVRLLSYAIGKMPADAEECGKLFEFGREMGVEAFVAELPPEALGPVEKLSEQYDIRVAAPSRRTVVRLGDVPDGGLEPLLAEIHRLGVKPVMFSIEPTPGAVRLIDAFHQQAQKLAKRGTP